jgi:hypothetical protein
MGHASKKIGYYEEIMPAHHRADCGATSVSDLVASPPGGAQWS